MMPPFRLDGKAAVVTGALGRLGPVWMETLLQAGARVTGLDLSAHTIPETFRQLQRAYPEHLLLLPADVRSRTDLLEVCRKSRECFGPASILVNNAGIDQPPGPVPQTWEIQDIPPEISRDIFEVNWLGLFQATQVFGRDMGAAGGGSIIHIGSLYAGVSPNPKFYDHLGFHPPFVKPPAYGASKAAVVSLTKYLAVHWGRQGIRVNTLSPGGVLGEQDPEFRRKFCDSVPLGRMATPEDLRGRSFSWPPTPRPTLPGSN